MKNLKRFGEWNSLNEEREHDYGCIMLYLNPPNWDKTISIIEKEDIYDKEGFGIENEPHVTILYGLHSDIPDSKIEENIKKMSSPEVSLQNISIFENDDYDVVKFDVEGKELYEMNAMFTKLPHTTDYPYNPHLTISYIKKGKGKKYIQKLSESIIVKPVKVVYSKANGSKKEYNLNGK